MTELGIGIVTAVLFTGLGLAAASAILTRAYGDESEDEAYSDVTVHSDESIQTPSGAATIIQSNRTPD